MHPESEADRRAALGQFLTPPGVAAFMASMFGDLGPEIRLLDAGAGAGSLTAAFLQEIASRSPRPTLIEATAYEVDRAMLGNLRRFLRSCEAAGARGGTRFVGHLVARDFLDAGTAALLVRPPTGAGPAERFDAAILNPPYRKIANSSPERRLLRSVGIEATNLYTAFVALAIRLLAPGGEVVAITPRSFCNGPYFRAFRRLLFEETALLQVHVFGARDQAFRDDAVLQENVIFHARKGARRGRVLLSTSTRPGAPVAARRVPHALVVDPGDPDAFLHLALSDEDAAIAQRMRALPCALADLGITVSTGRVVGFRARAFLRDQAGPDTVPLIHPLHLKSGFVIWPHASGRRSNALLDTAATRPLMVPSGTYVLTKRCTAKEEPRRIVAAVYDPARLPADVARVGFENHVNYFHVNGGGLQKTLAKGLAAYLDSSLVERYFRQFNGHTQVNAVDLRHLRYPEISVLKAIGRRIGSTFPVPARIDAIVGAALARYGSPD